MEVIIFILKTGIKNRVYSYWALCIVHANQFIGDLSRLFIIAFNYSRHTLSDTFLALKTCVTKRKFVT